MKKPHVRHRIPSLVVAARVCECHGDPVVYCKASGGTWCAEEIWLDGPPPHKSLNWPHPLHEYGEDPTSDNDMDGIGEVYLRAGLQGFLLRPRDGRLPPAPRPTRSDIAKAVAVAREELKRRDT